jgi:hypothetical protein
MIASTRRDWLASQCCEESPGFHLELGAAFSQGQPFQAEQNLATGNRTNHNAIAGSNG